MLSIREYGATLFLYNNRTVLMPLHLVQLVEVSNLGAVRSAGDFGFRATLKLAEALDDHLDALIASAALLGAAPIIVVHDGSPRIAARANAAVIQEALHVLNDDARFREVRAA